jgi:hypothetical protein
MGLKPMIIRYLGLLALSLALACLPARASFTVLMPGDFNMSPGETVLVDILLEVVPGGDNLTDELSVEYQITPAFGTPAGLVMVDASPLDAAHDPTLTESHYVFFGNSSITTLGDVFGVTSAGGTIYKGGDLVESDAVEVTSSNNLLTRLKLTAPLAGTGTYIYVLTINIPPSSLSRDFIAPVATETQLTIQFSAVPEPATLSIVSIGFVGAGCWHMRRATRICA